jgi:lipoyl(octanoyl) transferase
MDDVLKNRTLSYCKLGIIDYKEAWDLQRTIFNQVVDGETQDTLILLEHPHTYTLGKVADKKNLVSGKDYLEKNKISVFEIDRGGDITYHGPGQIVGYPIIKLEDWQKDTHKYLRALEEVIIMTCKNYGLDAGRNPKYTGVWMGNKKIAAIGVKISRWVTMHGFAFNVNTDLSLFKGIIPCGISDKEVTSLKKELGREINISDVKVLLLENFKSVFGYDSVNKISEAELRTEKMLN